MKTYIIRVSTSPIQWGHATDYKTLGVCADCRKDAINYIKKEIPSYLYIVDIEMLAVCENYTVLYSDWDNHLLETGDIVFF